MRTAHLAATLLVAFAVAAASPVQAQETSPLATLQALESVLVDVADAVRPAVVTIDVLGSSATILGADGGGRFEPIEGLGAGVIIDHRGTILTNHHVVAGSERLDVTLFDGREFRALVIAADERSDVGLIRLLDPPKDLKVAPIGDSDEVRVGQFGIAFGAPMGYQRTMSVGHVSALHRTALGKIRGESRRIAGFEHLAIQDFIQIDTAINPGNSGGPLVNIAGEVIGINTAMMAAPGGGMGFAIPINLAVRISTELERDGEVTLGWLGVRAGDNNHSLDEAFGRSIGKGAAVQEIFEGSPAQRAGMQQDDVIIEMGGRPILSNDDLSSAELVLEVGAEIPITLWRLEREGDVLTHLTVVLAERPAELAPLTASRVAPTIDGKGFLVQAVGIALEPTTREINSRLGRRPGAGGVHVEQVSPGSLAAEAGLEAGDVLLEIDGTEVDAPEDVESTVRAATRDFLPLVVERKGEQKYLSLERPGTR
jgi:serine protease Do